MNEDDIIPRSEELIDFNDFKRLHSLCNNYEWLEAETQGLYELWNLTDTETQKSLVEKLIENFIFIDSKYLKKITEGIRNHIVLNWGLQSRGTRISAICDNSNPDGSQAILQFLKDKFAGEKGWTDANFVNSLPVVANNCRNGQTIILIDDFIGTGNTIIRKLNYLKNTLKARAKNKVTIKIVTAAAMKFSKEVLDKQDVEHYSHLWLDKGISEIYRDPELHEAVTSMEAMEKKLGQKWNGKYLPKFGYQKSESLIAIDGFNIPNNVFPVFWWPILLKQIKRKTIFKNVKKLSPFFMLEGSK